MEPDPEGFLYPKVRQEDCLQCHICEKICPQINERKTERPKTPVTCYAAQSNDPVLRQQSSSGGVFTLLAKEILNRGGIVFGARFNDKFSVFHSYTDSEDGLSVFRGCKYAQSDLRGVYSQARQFLQEKRPVLFTGTPCQIAGLRAFLHEKEDDNLYLVSVVCHGVPSPMIWKDYLHSIVGDAPPTSVNMRNKEDGWKHYKLQIRRNGQILQNICATDTPFMKAFLNDLIIRPACYNCRFREEHGSDLTIGDYWGIEQIHPEMADDRGSSVILVYSRKGQQLLGRLDMIQKESRYEDVVRSNPSIVYPSPEPAERRMFWKSYRKHGISSLKKYTYPDSRIALRRLWARLSRRFRRRLSR